MNRPNDWNSFKCGLVITNSYIILFPKVRLAIANAKIFINIKDFVTFSNLDEVNHLATWTHPKTWRLWGHLVLILSSTGKNSITLLVVPGHDPSKKICCIGFHYAGLKGLGHDPIKKNFHKDLHYGSCKHSDCLKKLRSNHWT